MVCFILAYRCPNFASFLKETAIFDILISKKLNHKIHKEKYESHK